MKNAFFPLICASLGIAFACMPCSAFGKEKSGDRASLARAEGEIRSREILEGGGAINGGGGTLVPDPRDPTKMILSDFSGSVARLPNRKPGVQIPRVAPEALFNVLNWRMLPEGDLHVKIFEKIQAFASVNRTLALLLWEIDQFEIVRLFETDLKLANAPVAKERNSLVALYSRQGGIYLQRNLFNELDEFNQIATLIHEYFRSVSLYLGIAFSENDLQGLTRSVMFHEAIPASASSAEGSLGQFLKAGEEFLQVAHLDSPNAFAYDRDMLSGWPNSARRYLQRYESFIVSQAIHSDRELQLSTLRRKLNPEKAPCGQQGSIPERIRSCAQHERIGRNYSAKPSRLDPKSFFLVSRQKNGKSLVWLDPEEMRLVATSSKGCGGHALQWNQREVSFAELPVSGSRYEDYFDQLMNGYDPIYDFRGLGTKFCLSGILEK